MKSEKLVTEYTDDALFAGRLHCRQHVYGYRFSLDAVLVANFVKARAGEEILDIGAGCGVISLISCYRCAGAHLTSLEIQPQLVELIRQNIERNNFQEQMEVINGDLCTIRTLLPPESFDKVVCNPPYGKLATGRRNPGPEESIARHEVKAQLADIINAIFYSLKNRGRGYVIYPANRTAVLLASLKQNRLEPKKLQVVYSYPGSDGKLVLVEVVKNGGEEIAILPPFFVYQERGGEYSAEMAKLYKI